MRSAVARRQKALQNFAAEFIQSELDPDEQVYWVGQPAPSRVALFSISASCVGLLFATVIGVIIVGSYESPKADTRPTNLLGMPGIVSRGLFLPLVAGFSLLAVLAPLWSFRSAKRTAYAVTNRRILIIHCGRWRTVSSYLRRDINRTTVSEFLDLSGDLLFSHRLRCDADGYFCRDDESLIGIPHVRQVEQAIRMMKESKSTNPRPTIAPANEVVIHRIESSISDQLGHELTPGEQLLWAAQPESGSMASLVSWMVALGLVVLVFQLELLADLYLFRAPGAVGPWDVVTCLFLAFVVIVCPVRLLLAPRLARRWAKRTVYAFTNKRVLIISAPHPQGNRSCDYQAIGRIRRAEFASGSGMLSFSHRIYHVNNKREEAEDIALYGIAKVHAVDRLLRELLARDGDP